MDKSPEEQLYPSPTKDDVLFQGTEVSTPESENAHNASVDPVSEEERLRQEEEWKEELIKLEEEIQIMRQVLTSKSNQAAELKRKLGITAIAEMRQDLRQGLQNIKDSDAYKSTNDRLSQVGDKIYDSGAYQKTNTALKSATAKTATAFSSAGAFASKKLGDMRNSTAFKSFEEKLGGAYSNVRTRVRGSKSENNFEEALRTSSLAEEQNGGGGSMSYPASPMSPDEKVPL